MSIVLLTIGILVQKGLEIHDTVTGTMILQEALEEYRCSREEERNPEVFASEGTKKGDPRLRLGTYRICLEKSGKRIRGSAAAGDWSQEIERGDFTPAESIRIWQAVYRMGSNIYETGREEAGPGP